MQVRIPSPLRSYTKNADRVDASGATLAQVLADLDRQFPGIRFRVIDEHEGIRRHIKFFVNATQADDLGAPVAVSDEVIIVCALSGG
ncbi:MAG: MoaD/ThiS family protein [Betaproteobacteria bacterium]